MVKPAPIRGSSYLPLPADLLKHKRFLLSIRNNEEDRCFDYCLVAEYHRQNKIPLTLRTMHSKEAEKASFKDYRRNSRAHKPTVDFVDPTFFLIGANLYLSTSNQKVSCTFVDELLL